MSNLTLESSIASDICNPGCSPSSSFSTNLQDQPGEANLGQSAQGQPLEAVVGVSEIAQQKKNCGGLVLSCTVIVLLLGFLGAITAPCYIGSGSKARNSAVKGNMRTVQIAAESYATDQGLYPETIAELSPYLPGGDSKANGKAGVLPNNPMDGTTAQSLTVSTQLNSSALIRKARQHYDPSPTKLPPGQVLYCRADGGKSYSVTGVDEAGEILPNGTGELVLSNQ